MNLRKIALALGLATAACTGAAQAFPDKPIRMVVGFPAGQSSDAVARLLAQKMGETLKQPVVVDNKPGAAGIISHELVKGVPADGYTILLGSSGPLAINPALYRKLPYDPMRDFEPVGQVVTAPSVLFVSANSPVNSLRELIALAKSKPGKLSYGSPGSGTTAHIVTEMMRKAAGIDAVHVPYKGSPPMITDVVSGQLDFAFESAGAIVPFAKGGRVKLLAVSSAKRLPAIPDVPTVEEQGLAGFDALSWNAMVAPKGTPPAVIDTLNAALNKALKDPGVVAEFAKMSSTPVTGTPADLRRFLERELALWGKAVRDSGAQVD